MLRLFGTKRCTTCLGAQFFLDWRIGRFAHMEVWRAGVWMTVDAVSSMSLALEQVKDQLDFYRKSAEDTELVRLLLEAAAELKMCGIHPKDLSDAAEIPASPLSIALRQKAKELALIFMAYDALVAQSYVDPLDDLTRLKALLEEHAFSKNCVVALDSFQSFTVQEYQILASMLEQADEVYVSCVSISWMIRNGDGIVLACAPYGKHVDPDGQKSEG